MSWATMSVICAALYGGSSILDSHLLSKRLPSFKSFSLSVGMFQFICAGAALILFPFPQELKFSAMAATVASGIFRSIAALTMCFALQKQDASRVVPVVYTSPIFVAIMAVPLLGERLTLLEWLAILIVVGAAALISTEKRESSGKLHVSKLLLGLLGSSIFFAFADICRKYALADLSPWNAYGITSMILALSYLGFGWRRETFREWSELSKRGVALGLTALGQTMSVLGVVLQFWALQTGPVSLVAAIVGSRPVFVAVFSIIIGVFLPGFILKTATRRQTVVRFFATAMICAGISLIYLT